MQRENYMDSVSFETKCKQNTRKIKVGQVLAGNWLCRVISAREKRPQGYLTKSKFNAGRLRPEVQPHTLL